MTTRPQDYKNNPEVDRRTRRSPEVAGLIGTRLPEVDYAVEGLGRAFLQRFREFIPLERVVESPANVDLKQVAKYKLPPQVEAEAPTEVEQEDTELIGSSDEQADRERRIQEAQREGEGA